MAFRKCIALSSSAFSSVPCYPDGALVVVTLLASLGSVWDLYWLIKRFRMIKLIWIILPMDKGALSDGDAEQRQIIMLILATIISLSVVINLLLIQMSLSSYRWSMFWIRQLTKLAMYRSSLEFAIRTMNVLLYFSVQRHVEVELLLCAVHLALVLLCFKQWQQIYRKNVTLYFLNARRLSDTAEFGTLETTLVVRR